MKHLFLINPAAGSRNRQAELAGICRQVALDKSLEYEILVTEYPGHGVELVHKACQQAGGSHLRIYACGGDGTLNEAARGAYGMWNVAVGHYPVGTGNDFVKVFGPQAQAFQHLEDLVEGDEVEMDYVQASCGGALNILTVGVDARVAAGMRKYKRLPLLRGQGPYLLSAMENIIRGLGEDYCVTLDGKKYDGAYAMIFAANGCWYGGGFNPVPDADPSDGRLDVLLVRAIGRLTAARVIGAYKKGRYADYPQFITRVPARELTIRRADSRRICVNLDGEIAMTEEVQAVLRRGMHFIVPRGVQLAQR